MALETVLISTQHDPGVDLETLLLPDLRDNVINPLLPPELDTSGVAGPRQPDRGLRAGRSPRRHRPHRPQDHRRHLRRDGPPRRRRLLRQGPLEGRPVGRLRRALGGEERGGGGRRRPGAKSRWPTPSAWPGRCRCWSRRSGPSGRPAPHRGGGRRACSTSVPPPSSRELDLKRPIYRKTAAYGHFGRADKEFTWEDTARADELKQALGL